MHIIYTYIHICTYTYIQTHTFTLVSAPKFRDMIYLCRDLSMRISMYIMIYVHTHTYESAKMYQIHEYMNMCIHT